MTKLSATTRVVVLQHPRERDMPIGTARMATLCLPNSELHEGVRWEESRLDRLLGDAEKRPILLYPGEGARDIGEHPPDGPVTLVVIDGTWWQARKILRENPRLQSLPRYTFTPPAPSEYRIRAEPVETYVSTIEAIMHVLGVLEGDRARFHPLLEPFRAMIDTQIECEDRLRGAGSRHAHKVSWKKRAQLPRVPALLSCPRSDIVCVAGEANAWPYSAREKGESYEDELVHWVAHRLGTGETFERLVAPRRPLAPRTPHYVELSREAIAAGGTHDSMVSDWRAFARDTDVVCFWGHYATALFIASGGTLSTKRVDLRKAARDFVKRKVGTLEEFVAEGGIRPDAMTVRGRAGRRLSQACAVALRLMSAGEVGPNA